MNFPAHQPVGLALLLTSLVVACGGDDDDGDDGGDDAADSSTDPSAGDDPPPAADDDTVPSDDDDSDGDDGDPSGDSSCGVVPQMCVDFVDHLIECDPASEDLADEAENECACGLAMYPDTPECQAAVDAYFECASTFPCDMPEMCLDAGFAMAGACGG